MSRRTDRLGDLLQQEISQIVAKKLGDPRLKALVTVTRVDVSPSLEHASVAISIMGTVEQQKQAIEGLESASGFVRRELGHRLRLRQVPRLRFLLDTSIAEGQRMLSLLDRIRPPEPSHHD